MALSNMTVLSASTLLNAPSSNDAARNDRPPQSPSLVVQLESLHKDQLDEVVNAVKRALSDPSLRQLSQRAVQAKIWHDYPVVAALLQRLRSSEEAIRSRILALISKLVYQFHEHAVDATLERAGIMNASNSSTPSPNELGSVCLDAKERLYILLKEYDWLRDFFRLYPIHFYENSFSFVHQIPTKSLDVKVKVVGLGIGGSMAVSGLAKRGISVVHGYEKRPEHGPRSVTSRYQNASWRAYDTAAHMVNEATYKMLVEHRQRIHMQQPQSTASSASPPSTTSTPQKPTIVETDRVQIILGSAIQAALDSARSYGARLNFECSTDDVSKDKNGPSDNHNEDTDVCYDLVALFCGAHTTTAFGMGHDVWQWPELTSYCKMWLRVQSSDKVEPYCTRGGEIGAEHWHYTIESARCDVRDLERVAWNQASEYQHQLVKCKTAAPGAATVGSNDCNDEEELTRQYSEKKSKLEAVVQSTPEGCRFDYIFTNAPLNEHNMAKREQVLDSIVLDGDYSVPVQIATQSTVTTGPLLKQLCAKLVVMGGDATVPPNPLAAYGATLACEAASSVVLLATAIGHLNAITRQIQELPDCPDNEQWIGQLDDLKELLRCHFEARSRSETYFQFVQTLICNAYSLPPFY